jgi:hypothetical protein
LSQVVIVAVLELVFVVVVVTAATTTTATTTVATLSSILDRFNNSSFFSTLLNTIVKIGRAFGFFVGPGRFKIGEVFLRGRRVDTGL